MKIRSYLRRAAVIAVAALSVTMAATAGPAMAQDETDGSDDYSDFGSFSGTASVSNVRQQLTTTVPICRIGYTEPPFTAIHYWYVQQDVTWQSATRSDGVKVHRLYSINVLIKDGGGNPITRGNYFDHKLYQNGVYVSKDRIRPWSTISATLTGDSLMPGSSRRWSGYLVNSGTGVTSSWVPRDIRVSAVLDVVADYPFVQMIAASRIPFPYNGQYLTDNFGLCHQSYTSPYTIFFP